MKEPYRVRLSEPLWPRVMRRLTVRQRRSVDRGRTGQPLSSAITHSGCRPCDLKGKARRSTALSRVVEWTRGVKDPVHVRTLFSRKPGDPGDDLWSIYVRSGRRRPVAKCPTCTFPGSRMEA